MSEARLSPDSEPFIDKADHIEWQSRLAHISAEYGFLPTTTIELNKVFDVMSFDPKRAHVGDEPEEEIKGNTAQHLNTILRHQVNLEYPLDAAQDAVRSVTRLLYGFATDADTRAGRITDLLGAIHLVNPNLDLELVDEAKTNEGLIDLMQFLSAQQAAGAGGSFLRGRLIGESGDRVLRTDFEVDVTDEILIELMTEDLQHMSVLEIRQLAEKAVASHKNRSSFWRNRLREARIHSIANRLLKELDFA